eukprot:Plantae.Rhodophyta-Rhodochaete_pulchella.ctg26086.p6 GENE.Plantae.Rhodophyta-Rhodochaete_pulchella.ctg26086~~Plantae.Rhodophyta-Rhodochaete_pulchella.ctg26086.p6  ORF type:complete len:110 (-),score=13.48 Plantae.Rhodophyta-Rhodochaete_pulchella.ctg26086:965-1294(-)
MDLREAEERNVMPFVRTSLEKVQEWYKSSPRPDSLEMEPASDNYRRRLVYEAIERDFPDVKTTLLGGGSCPDPPALVIRLASEEDIRLREQKRQERVINRASRPSPYHC